MGTTVEPLMSDKTGKELVAAIKSQASNETAGKSRVSSKDDTELAYGSIISVVGIPSYVSDVSRFSDYGITDPGWYVFAKIEAAGDVRVTAETTIQGAEGHRATPGANYVDVAIKFEVAAISRKISIEWGPYTDTFIFVANDLAIRNLDYRVTFYVYDADRFGTWTYALTTDTAFAAGKNYYTKEGDTYTLAEVTEGAEVPADTYYVHSKLTFSGMVRNVTYNFNQVIDCPVEFILPEVTDEEHGFWFEIHCLFDGQYSMTLVPPSADVKVATEHTQQEQKGINMINLLYTSVAGAKVWRFMNTRSTIPE